MTRAAPRSRLAWPLALVFLTITSLLPARWLGLAGDLSAVLSVVLAPLGHAGNSVAAWLQPPPARFEELPPLARDFIEQLDAEKALAERLFRVMEQRVAELEAQIEELQLARTLPLPLGAELILAPIVGRHPTDLHGPVRLATGARDGVRPNIIAVYNGIHLVGRVGSVDPLSSELTPLTHRATGGISALVFPAENRLELTIDDAAPTRLLPEHDGTLRGDVDRASKVRIGDVVVLSDPAWPTAAQFRRLGEVLSIRPRDDQPLRERIVVRPRYLASDLAAVTLILERLDDAEDRPSSDVGGTR